MTDTLKKGGVTICRVTEWLSKEEALDFCTNTTTFTPYLVTKTMKNGGGRYKRMYQVVRAVDLSREEYDSTIMEDVGRSDLYYWKVLLVLGGDDAED